MRKNLEKYQGMYSALVCPFSKKGRVNLDIVCRLVDAHLKAGLKGFYVCGTTGEGIKLSIEERKAIVETVVEHARGRGYCIVSVSHASSDIAGELAGHAEEAGADMVSTVPAIYYPTGFKGIYHHYNTICSYTKLPMLIYWVPVMSGVTLSTDEFNRFFEIPNVIGMKFSDPHYARMTTIIEAQKGNCLAFSGYDELCLPGLIMGSSGAIGSTINLAPKAFVRLKKLYDAGKIGQAQQLQFRIVRLVNALLPYGFTGWKEAMTLSGYDCGPARAPFIGMTAGQKKKLAKELEPFNDLLIK